MTFMFSSFNAKDADKFLGVLIYKDKVGAKLLEKNHRPLTATQKLYTIIQVCHALGLEIDDIPILYGNLKHKIDFSNKPAMVTMDTLKIKKKIKKEKP